MNQPSRSTGLALLKASVIAMGIVIVVGVGALVYTLASRTGAPGQPSAAGAAILRLGLPAETQVRSMATTDRALTLHLAVPGQGEWIYVVPLTGEGRLLKIAIGGGDTK